VNYRLGHRSDQLYRLPCLYHRCKSENDVPLGVFRTWVKNVEVGRFPAARRHFAVLRCNHCAEPPAFTSARPVRCSSGPTASWT